MKNRSEPRLQQAPDASAALAHRLELVDRDLLQLSEPGGGRGEEQEEGVDTGLGLLVAGLTLSALHGELAEHLERGVHLALLPLLEDAGEHLPDVLQRLEVVAPVAEDADRPDQAPREELPEARAHVGARGG